MLSEGGPLGSEPTPALQPASDSPAETPAQVSSLCGLGVSPAGGQRRGELGEGSTACRHGTPSRLLSRRHSAPGGICYGRLHMPPTTPLPPSDILRNPCRQPLSECPSPLLGEPRRPHCIQDTPPFPTPQPAKGRC